MTRAILAPTRYPGLKVAYAGAVTHIAPLEAPVGGTRFSLEVPDEYAYYAPLNDGHDWVRIDETGVLEITPPADEPSGIMYVPVHVSHGDESDIVFVNVQIVAEAETGVNDLLPAVSFGGCVRVTAGEARKVTPMLWDRANGEILAGIPEGYAFTGGKNLVDWVKVSANGEVTARPQRFTAAGTYHVPVVMTEIRTGATTTALGHVEVAGSDSLIDVSLLVAGAGLLGGSLIVLLAQFGMLPTLF